MPRSPRRSLSFHTHFRTLQSILITLTTILPTHLMVSINDSKTLCDTSRRLRYRARRGSLSRRSSGSKCVSVCLDLWAALAPPPVCHSTSFLLCGLGDG